MKYPRSSSETESDPYHKPAPYEGADPHPMASAYDTTDSSAEICIAASEEETECAVACMSDDRDDGDCDETECEYEGGVCSDLCVSFSSFSFASRSASIWAILVCYLSFKISHIVGGILSVTFLVQSSSQHV